MIEQKIQKLIDAGIEVVPVAEMSRHILMGRDGYIALVERRDDGFGNIGAAGLATEGGFAVLSYRGSEAFFVAKGGFEQAATAGQIAALKAFEADLRAALA